MKLGGNESNGKGVGHGDASGMGNVDVVDKVDKVDKADEVGEVGEVDAGDAGDAGDAVNDEDDGRYKCGLDDGWMDIIVRFNVEFGARTRFLILPVSLTVLHGVD